MKYTMPEIEEAKRLADTFINKAEAFIAKGKLIHVYCNCNNQQPEEVKSGVFLCLNCNNDIDPAEFSEDAPEPSEEEIDFYNSAGNEWAQREANI